MLVQTIGHKWQVNAQKNKGPFTLSVCVCDVGDTDAKMGVQPISSYVADPDAGTYAQFE